MQPAIITTYGNYKSPKYQLNVPKVILPGLELFFSYEDVIAFKYKDITYLMNKVDMPFRTMRTHRKRIYEEAYEREEEIEFISRNELDKILRTILNVLEE